MRDGDHHLSALVLASDGILDFAKAAMLICMSWKSRGRTCRVWCLGVLDIAMVLVRTLDRPLMARSTHYGI